MAGCDFGFFRRVSGFVQQKNEDGWKIAGCFPKNKIKNCGKSRKFASPPLISNRSAGKADEMKPGKNDIPIKQKISGRQLEELQRHTWHMCEAFGLDTKIEKYKGVRPISFYSWDLDCILDVLSMVLDDENEYPDKNDAGYFKLHELYMDLKKAYEEIY